jgi:outer membrane protein assembly factor BamB
MTLPLTRCILALAVCASLCPVVSAENWPQWRGPRLDGVSKEKGIPHAWNKTENVAWRLALPGPGGSTPVVWDDRIFLTTVDGDDLQLWCVGVDGKPMWKRSISKGNYIVRGGEGNSASPSPSTDGKHVWAMMTDGKLTCFTVDGEEVWKVDLQERYGDFQIQFGMTSTPVLDGDRLYLQLIHGEGDPNTREAIVVALDKNTGKEVWKQPRPSDASAECEHSYASPTIYRDGEREFLISHGADYVIGHRLEDGAEIWRSGGLNPESRYNPTLRFVATPVAAEGLIVVPSAKKGPVLGLKPDLKGDVTGDESAFYWRRTGDTPDVPSPLVVDGLVYLYREDGIVICMDAKTGEEIYKERTVGGVHRASPLYADGKIFLAARVGVVTVIKAGRKFEILASNDMGEEIASSPIVANGRLYLRTFDALYAIGK